jgi:hypothetical protein
VATDGRGKVCGLLYDPMHAGWCANGHRCWEETAPAAAPASTDEAEEDAFAERDRGRLRPPDAEAPSGHAYGSATGGAGEGARGPHRAVQTPTERQQAGIRVLRPGDGDAIVLTSYPGILSTVLGGLAHGKVHAILGIGGAGKSTVAAQAAAAIAELHQTQLWWLDGDQGTMDLIRQSFHFAAAADRYLRVPRAPEGQPPFTWQQALAAVPSSALVMVVDSLETWAPKSDQARGELVRALRTHPCRFKLLIAAADKDDNVTGAGLLERAWDASVFVHKRAIHVGKTRWVGESVWKRYRVGTVGVRLLVRPVEEPDDEDEDEDADGEGEEHAAAAAPEPVPLLRRQIVRRRRLQRPR